MRGAATALGDGESKGALKAIVSPPSLSKTFRNAGLVLLVVTPDPVTAIPGAAFMGASYAARRREAASLEAMRKEAVKAVRLVQDLQSLL